jgi:hypothetical protein
VLFQGWTVDQDVIHISYDALIVQVSEYTIHHPHKRSRCITQSERKDAVLEVSVPSSKSSFVLVSRSNQDVIEPIA